jgi:tRNA pseudouridine32 synthase/23S rRNA pseudouridine746 synthase
VHSAHPSGLNLPIVGDDLYGNSAERLYLHAERLEFKHPVSQEAMQMKAPVPF